MVSKAAMKAATLAMKATTLAMKAATFARGHYACTLGT